MALMLSGCDFFGGGSVSSDYLVTTESATLTGRRNAVTMDNRGSATAVWIADGMVQAQRYEAGSGWGDVHVFRSDFNGSAEHLNAAMTFTNATVVWEETPSLGSGAERQSFAAHFANNTWSSAPIAVSINQPGTDPNVGANLYSTDEYIAAIAWNELGNGTNTTSGSSFQTLIPYYREQRGSSPSLSQPMLIQGVPEQAWLADNINVAMDGASNTFIVWARQTILSDNTIVHGIYASRKTPDASPGEPRLIGFAETVSNVQLYVDQAGNANVYWLQNGRLQTNRYSATQGLWRDADEAITIGTQTDIVDYDVDINAVGRLGLAWTTESRSAVHTALQFPNSIPTLSSSFETQDVRDLKIGIDDQHNMRLVVQSGAQLFSAYYQENIVDWSALEFVTAITVGNLSFDMDGSGTAVAIWDLEAGSGIGQQVWVPGAPTATFTATPNPAEVNQLITFDASASTANSSIAGYQWDFDNDGSYDATGGPIVNHSYTTSGDFTARLRVTDNQGLFSESTRSLVVNNTETQQFSLTVSVNMAAGTVTSMPTGINCGGDCDEMYVAGTTVVLTATPQPGFVLANWNGACEGLSRDGNQVAITINGDVTCEAEFVAQSGTVSLFLTINGQPGRVFEVVTGFECVNPAGQTVTNCTGNFQSGVTLLLQVESEVPNEWLFGCDSEIPIDVTNGVYHCMIAMTSNREVSVYFETPN
jgi:hypothetical protein